MKSTTLLVATGLALGTALISGVSNFIAKISVTVVKDPVVFTTLKNVVVAVFLLAAIIVFRKWRELRALNRRQWAQLVAIGVVGGSVPFALYFTGLTQTSALNASLIHKSLFLWVALLALPLLKERMTRWQWAGIAVVAVANVFIGGFKGFKLNTGELMILGATMLWAVENVVAKRVLVNVSSLTVASARMLFGSVVLIGFIAVQGRSIAAVTSLTVTQWSWTLLSSVLLIGYVTTWYAALKRAPATYVATLLVPATLVTNILTALFVTRAFTLVQFVNGTLLLVGAWMLIRFPRRSTSTATAQSAPPANVRA